MLRGDYLTGVFIPQIERFDKMFSGTVFPPFADPEMQAEKVAKAYWDQKMSEPCGPDGPDEDQANVAEDAHQESLEFYETVTAMHNTVVNLFTAGVFHLFEQQAGTLLKDWTGTRPGLPFEALGKLSLKGAVDKLTDVKAAPMWPKLDELRLVANVVKHAEGDSADKLRGVNGAYFKLPAVRGTDLEKYFGERMLGEPLAGEGIYVTKSDYDAFVAAVIDFWNWLTRVVG